MVKEEILPLGVMTGIGANPIEALSKIQDFGIHTCQLGNPPDEYIYDKKSDELNRKLKSAIEKTGMKISSVFIMYEGHIWDLIDGPRTIGLVPENTRAPRVVHACAVSNWARKIGIKVVTSHMGFIPTDNTTLLYQGFIETMKKFVAFCEANDQLFAFETGQESPIVLRRAIDDIGVNNVRVNLDSANLLMYGMGKPLEAVRLLGEFVVNTHCKDGRMPEAGGKLGSEMPLGEGDVHYEEVLPALYEKGFRGPLTIEREISGAQQIDDIKRAMKLLERIKRDLST